MERDGSGSALGRPVSPAGSPSVQAGACTVCCSDACGEVSEIPDRDRQAGVAGAHTREGRRVAPGVAVATKKRKVAAVKTAGKGNDLTTTDGGSTDSTVLLETGVLVQCGGLDRACR